MFHIRQLIRQCGEREPFSLFEPSLANRKGRTFAIRISGLVFSLFFVLTLIPFLAGWLGYEYLILIAVTDLWMIWCCISLVRCRTREGGRLQIRRLYLSWGLFVIAFTITRILL
jgi:geranylgeranylglycerol-phosphate geranylgeranyltransferase